MEINHFKTIFIINKGIYYTEIQNIHRFQPLQCEDFLLSSVLYQNMWEIFSCLIVLLHEWSGFYNHFVYIINTQRGCVYFDHSECVSPGALTVRKFIKVQDIRKRRNSPCLVCRFQGEFLCETRRLIWVYFYQRKHFLVMNSEQHTTIMRTKVVLLCRAEKCTC